MASSGLVEHFSWGKGGKGRKDLELESRVGQWLKAKIQNLDTPEFRFHFCCFLLVLVQFPCLSIPKFYYLQIERM